MFIIDKRSIDEPWFVHSIEAAVQIETVRNPERVLVVGKIYLHTNGPLPNKDKIKDEVMKMVRIENIKEHAYKAENDLLKQNKRSHHH